MSYKCSHLNLTDLLEGWNGRNKLRVNYFEIKQYKQIVAKVVRGFEVENKVGLMFLQDKRRTKNCARRL